MYNPPRCELIKHFALHSSSRGHVYGALFKRDFHNTADNELLVK